MVNLTHELNTALLLAGDAARAILPYYYGRFEQHDKADGSPVTQADLLSNRIILEGLACSFPQDGIVSEELDTVRGNRYWYVDPIDGTKGFIAHSDQFAIHIGLADEQPLLGLIYKPTTGEYYYAMRGTGAYRVHPDGSRRALHVAPSSESLRIVINGGFLREEPRLVDSLNPSKVHISGGAGLRVMRVAEGHADVYLKTRLNTGGTWDICAPHAILDEAGGYSMNANGIPLTYSGQRNLDGRLVMAANEDIAKRVTDLLNTHYAC